MDYRAVLERLVQEVPVSTWRYEWEAAPVRHIGPMATDFARAFAVGETVTEISAVDADGVALAAIHGLYRLSQGQAAQITVLQAENGALRTLNEAQQAQLDDLAARLAALEEAKP